MSAAVRDLVDRLVRQVEQMIEERTQEVIAAALAELRSPADRPGRARAAGPNRRGGNRVAGAGSRPAARGVGSVLAPPHLRGPTAELHGGDLQVLEEVPGAAAMPGDAPAPPAEAEPAPGQMEAAGAVVEDLQEPLAEPAPAPTHEDDTSSFPTADEEEKEEQPRQKRKGNYTGNRDLARALLAKLEALRPYFDQLEPAWREMVTLRLDGVAAGEIASRMGRDEKAVRTAISKARRQLERIRDAAAPADPEAVVYTPEQFAALKVQEVRVAPPTVPQWIVDRLPPNYWEAYSGMVVEGCSPQTIAYLRNTTAGAVTRNARSAEAQIRRLMTWEATRAAEGNPLTDAERAPPPDVKPDVLVELLHGGKRAKVEGRWSVARRAMLGMQERFAELPDRARAIAELFVEGKTYQQIADQLEIASYTVGNSLLRTRRILSGGADGQALTITGRAASITGRKKTISLNHLTREERRAGEELQHPTDILRPLKREDCQRDPGRPCPWVSCRHHNYLDVNEETGAITLNWPGKEVWEIPETCSLDVADRGGITLEEVGAIVNLTRERIRQVEVRALATCKESEDDIDYDPDAPDVGTPLARAIA